MDKEHREAIEEFISPPKPSTEEVSKTGTDTYCYELMSMVIGLSGNSAGCTFLASNEGLVKDLFCLLHVGSMRVQLEVRCPCGWKCWFNVHTYVQFVTLVPN